MTEVASACIGVGSPGARLDEAQVQAIVTRGLSSLPLDGRRLLGIIPDGTRTQQVARLAWLDAFRAQPHLHQIHLGDHPQASRAHLN